MPVQMSCDSVVLEMFFVRVPFGDQKANVKLWDEIDEQRFSPELREKLAQNGFRAGIIDGQISSELASLLQLADKPPPNELERTKVSEQELTEQPKVVRRHLQLRAGQRSEIIASGVYDSLPLLKQEQGQLCGQTYNQAQGIFAVKAIPQLDGQVRLELLPELHHDQPRQRWVGNQGMLRLESGRPREEFSDMAIRIDMAPGAMLILSSLPNRPGSLGHYFFTENTGKLEQKVLIIRISQTQQDGLFNVPETSETTDPNAKNS